MLIKRINYVLKPDFGLEIEKHLLNVRVKIDTTLLKRKRNHYIAESELGDLVLSENLY
jgi:hypothetical protein